MATRNRIHALALIMASLPFLANPLTASAIKLKIKQPQGLTSVATSDSGEMGTLSSKRGTIEVAGTKAQLTVLSSTGPLPVIVGYKIGSKVLPPKVVLAKASKYCASGSAKAYTALKGSSATLTLKARSGGDVAYFNGTIGSGNGTLAKRSLANLVSVDASCLPSGNGLTEGLQKSSATVVARATDAISSDSDSDGLADAFDSDTDGDGILNNYDPSFTVVRGAFKLFSNLKVSLENTLNVNALGREPTEAEVDALTRATTLAIEVKATGSDESELNCGTLGYCSAGGTGTVVGGSSSFPGASGGVFDSDSDGFGTITPGSTGDFQLATNLQSFNDLNAGDAFIQTVSSGGRVTSIYATALQFAFRSTPAIKNVVIDPAGARFTSTFSYPIAEGALGTNSNCIAVEPDGSGKMLLEITAWRPQRKGLSALGEASFVDLGNSMVAIDLPNAPSLSGTGAGGGPGLCPATSYSTTDPNLSLSGDTLRDTKGDTNADITNTLTFTVDFVDCLRKTGLTIHPAEQLKVDLQFKNAVGDNAAQSFCIFYPL